MKNLLHTNNSHVTRRPDEASSFCNTIANFFCDKVINLKSSIAAKLSDKLTNPFAWDGVHNGTRLDVLQQVTSDEVADVINSMSSKSSPLDYIPSSLLKKCVVIFAPAIANLANLSFGEGRFPELFKTAQVTPLLKKPGLDVDSSASYRPISNLNSISKILEKLFASRLKSHIKHSPNINMFQSAYKQFNSTETALLKIMNDIFADIDAKKVTVLIALDLSAAFDTLDHSTVLQRLSNSFGLSGPALDWVKTYLVGRSQFAKVDSAVSQTLGCDFSVPQGSVLGPLIFSLFISPVANLISSFNVHFHQYADDTQLYIGVSPGGIQPTKELINDCTSTLQNWFLENGLCLNPDKSEALIIGTGACLRTHFPEPDITVPVANCPIKVKCEIKNLGVVLDRTLSLDKHVEAVCKSAHCHIRALQHIRGSLSVDQAKSVACAIIGSRLDYCNGLFYGISAVNILKLQHVQNSAVRVVKRLRKFDHVKPAMKELHWLPVSQRIMFIVATITFKVLNSSEPKYLRELLNRYEPVRSLRSCDHNLLTVPRCRTVIASRAFSVAAPSLWNSLPNNIKNSGSIAIFKKNLKTHLFNLAYDCIS